MNPQKPENTTVTEPTAYFPPLNPQLNQPLGS